MNYSSTTIVGRLTRAAKVFAADGDKQALVAFSVAVNTGKDKTTYFEVEDRGDRASKISDFLVAGKEVLVEGNIALNTYTKTDGTTASSLKLYANRVQLGADPATAGASADREMAADPV